MKDIAYQRKLQALLGKEVEGSINRPLGSRHPKYHEMVYPINYGYIDGFMAPDGMEQDVYVIGTDKPIHRFKGTVIAIIEREDDIEDKLVVSLNGNDYSAEEIEKLINFQERYFKHKIIRRGDL